MKTFEEETNVENKESFNIDIVMVIDATKDSPFANNRDFLEKLILQAQKMIECEFHRYRNRLQLILRMKVMYFRDFYFDGKYAFGESCFYNLPMELPQLLGYIDELSGAGGGDIPESGLEALWLAMNTNFSEGTTNRHIIELFTNAPAHSLEEYKELVKVAHDKHCCPPVNYPKQIPKSLEDFLDAWNNWSKSIIGRSVIIVAPFQEYPWADLELDCQNIIPHDTPQGNIDFDDLVDEIVNFSLLRTIFEWEW